MVENRPLYSMYRAAAHLGKNVGLGYGKGTDGRWTVSQNHILIILLACPLA